MNKNEKEKIYAHMLYSVDGIGNMTAKKLLMEYGSVYEIAHLNKSQIEKCGCLTNRQKMILYETMKKWNLEKECEIIKNKQIDITFYGHENYPKRLYEVEDAPFILYYKGKLPDDDTPSVAIIGARMCSEYGRGMAKYFSSGLAEKGIQIISGMASGVDGTAQSSAIACRGNSFGILGCGVDICYPASNQLLYRKLVQSGGVISEYVPGTMPEAGNFPRRNRVISALADLILVVEAKEKSGSRITVNLALEQGKEVYAVPGRITEELSRGCNNMIRDGAGIAMEVKEVANAAIEAFEKKRGITWNYGTNKLNERKDKTVEYAREQDMLTFGIMKCLSERSMTADEIYRGLKEEKTGPDFSKLQERLMELYLEHRIVENCGVYSMVP